MSTTHPPALARDQRNRICSGIKVPRFVLMTDDDRLPDPSMLIPLLPVRSAIVVRSKSPKNRDALADRISKVCRRHHIPMLISHKKPPQILVGDGLHIPEAARSNWSRRDFRRLQPSLITTSAHNLRAAQCAYAWGADAVFLSPIAPTQSHPNGKSLGFWRGASIQHQIDIPAIALGGIDLKSVRRIFDLGFGGCAGIGLFAP